MVGQTATSFLPVEIVFNPRWWNQTAGISFERDFYFDIQTREQSDLVMRRILYERFGEYGFGDENPQARPVIGSMYVAGGFVIPALLGVDIQFEVDAAPQPLPVKWTTEQIDKFEKPNFKNCWPMNELIAGMDEQEARFGYLVGDLNTDGVLNAAYHLYGQELFADFYQAPERVSRLLEQISDLIVDVATYIRQRSGTSSVSVNRMVSHFDPSPFLHANCSVQMISPRSYRQLHLPVELRMAEKLQPFGIHHCGNNMHQVAASYAQIPGIFFDVGWGSDVVLCRKALPHAFLNLRLSPVRMLQNTPFEIAADTEALLKTAGPLEQTGICCINMDYGTPDENIRAMLDVVNQYRSYGA